MLQREMDGFRDVPVQYQAVQIPVPIICILDAMSGIGAEAGFTVGDGEASQETPLFKVVIEGAIPAADDAPGGGTGINGQVFGGRIAE